MASRGINKVILIGNLGADPEVRYMPNGNAVANVRLATSESWKDKNSGDTQERTEWHRVTFYRRLAEIVGEYLKKGSKIYVEGRLQTREWEDKDSIKRWTTEIIADNMQMLDSRGEGGMRRESAPGDRQAPAAGQTTGSGKSSPAPSQANNDFDDDIPF